MARVQQKADPWRDWTLAQNSPEWQKKHRFRREEQQRPIYTASRVPSVYDMGYDSAHMLQDWYWGVRSEEEDNRSKQIYFDYGHDHEEEARQQFLSEVPFECFCVTPGMKWDDQEENWGCSIDGFLTVPSPAGTIEYMILEIKCPYTEKIPEEPKATHFIQVQFQFRCMGEEFQRAILYYWTPKGTKGFMIYRDNELIEDICSRVKRHEKLMLKKDVPLRCDRGLKSYAELLTTRAIRKSECIMENNF